MKEGTRNILGVYDLFAMGIPSSLDTRSGEATRTLYYSFDDSKPYQEIDFTEKPLFISDKKVLLRDEAVVFEYHSLSRVTLPGASTTLEKLVYARDKDLGASYVAEMVPGLNQEQISLINSLDRDAKQAVLSDLVTHYPRFVITEGNIVEGYLADGRRPLVKSAGYSELERIEGFIKPYQKEENGSATWKIAKEYPQKNEHEKVILSFGINYSLPEKDDESMLRRADEFGKAIELGGEDAREMLSRIARPTIEIRKQNLYDTGSL